MPNPRTPLHRREDRRTPELQSRSCARHRGDPASKRLLERLERSAREGTPAAGQAGLRPDRARHPPRPHRRPAQAAPVPGSRAPGGGDHRRLHGHGRRSQRPLEDPAAALRRGRSRPTRAPTSSSSSASRSRRRRSCQSRSTGTASGSRRCASRTSCACASQYTVARLLERDDFAKRSQAHSRSASTSCCIRSCRATIRSRSGPTSSSAARSRSSTCWSAATLQERRAGAAGHPHAPDPRRASTASSDEQEPRQLHRRRRPPREQFGKVMSIPDERRALLLAARDRRAAEEIGGIEREARRRAPIR